MPQDAIGTLLARLVRIESYANDPAFARVRGAIAASWCKTIAQLREQNLERLASHVVDISENRLRAFVDKLQQEKACPSVGSQPTK